MEGQKSEDGGQKTDGGGNHPTPNDQRSDVYNPNNPVYQAAVDHGANQLNPNNPTYQTAADNRANQMNPNNPAYQASRSGSKKWSGSTGGTPPAGSGTNRQSAPQAPMNNELLM